MSHSVMSSVLFKFCVVYLVVRSVEGYENAYDLLERRTNNRYYEPRYFQPATFYHDRNRFFPEDRNSHSGYGPLGPYHSEFGNGYDNLGNGIPPNLFSRHPGGWRFQRRPFRERTYNNFQVDLHSSSVRPEHDIFNHLSGGYHPRTYVAPPVGIYGNEFHSSGNTNVAKVDRFIQDNENQNQKKTNELYQRSQEGVNLDSFNKETAGEQLHTDQTGENKSSLRSNKVVKKGRTTKGFAIHHHKDETGNSTTFFDESSDFGGQSDLRDITDGFNTRRTLEQMTQKGDEKFFKENEEQTGNYGSGLLSGNRRLENEFSLHQDSAKKFHTGNENDDLGLRKTYQYLNGDRFDYEQPHVDNYY